MGSESLHAPRENLSRETLNLHHAIVSLKEELDAVDWYRQRADDCDDPALREILLHNMREEMEHACMVLEWMRRSDPDWAGYIEGYLFTSAPITEVEEEETGKSAGAVTAGSDDGDQDASGDGAEEPAPPPEPVQRRFTIGALK